MFSGFISDGALVCAGLGSVFVGPVLIPVLVGLPGSGGVVCALALVMTNAKHSAVPNTVNFFIVVDFIY